MEKFGSPKWQHLSETCRQIMPCFPDSLYAGIDMLITSDFESHKVLEVNAFGDLLPRIEFNGMDTYSAEIAAAVAVKM
jgi:hypothetical protein